MHDEEPDRDEYCPEGQGPVQADVFKPVVEPNSPAAQLVHEAAPAASLYVPTGHMVHALLRDDAKRPGSHVPVQADVFKPVVEPY